MTTLEEAANRSVSRETSDVIGSFAQFLSDEAGKQNLVASSTLSSMWERHIVDSAQLVRFEPNEGASWVDIGSGAGLPGIVIGAIVAGQVLLVEPRRLRAEFLNDAVGRLGLADRVRVLCAKAERARGRFDVITARAVASLDKLLSMTLHLAHSGTVWVLPKGRSAKSELEEARRNWQCDARVEGSMTDPDAAILVIRNVSAKGRA